MLVGRMYRQPIRHEKNENRCRRHLISEPYSSLHQGGYRALDSDLWLCLSIYRS